MFHELELTDPFLTTEQAAPTMAKEVRECNRGSKDVRSGQEAKHEWGLGGTRGSKSRSWKVRNTHRFRAILNALRLTGTPKVSPAPPASKIPKPKPVAGKAPAGKAPAGKAAAKK